MYEPNYVCPPPVGGDVFELILHAIGKAEELLKRLMPLTYPPSGLHVTTEDGAPISGVIVVDRGRLVVGLIARGCRQDDQTRPAQPMGRPLVDIYRDDTSTRLRGWADNDEEDPWPG